MANGWLLEQEIDLSQPISRQYTSPYGIALTGDDRAQRLRYTVYDGQDAADLSGTVKVYYRRPDDTLIESTSGGDYVTVAGNIVTAELPPEAYEQKGTVECLVKLYASDGKVVTLARCDIEVRRGVENDETIIPAGEASRASLEDRVAALEVATGVVPIDQLPDLPHDPQTGDYLEVEDGNGPYKIDYVALADAIIARAAANNLTTTIAGKLLDARQGKALNDSKQDVLTFDSTPTADSANPVTSGGIKTALDGKQGTLTFDATPTTGSTNPVTSGGIADAITQSTASTKSGIVTMATGTSQIFVRQYGNVVCIGGWVSNATLTANTRTKIADITGISYPPDVVRAFCNVGANAYSVGTLSYISLSTSGELTVTSSNGGTGKAIYFDICYVANN